VANTKIDEFRNEIRSLRAINLDQSKTLVNGSQSDESFRTIIKNLHYQLRETKDKNGKMVIGMKELERIS
jgi:hypothetical protein